MEKLLDTAINIHGALFAFVEKTFGTWLLGFAARLVFASVLLTYYVHSAGTKVHEGFPGVFVLADNAYYQILPQIIEAAGYDSSKIALFPWKIIAYLGTYCEFILPVLIVLGLFTRLASVGMIVFIVVQSFVDVRFHAIGAEATGAMFDRFPDSVIFDQRLLWMFPLFYLVARGAGLLSLDAALSRFWQQLGAGSRARGAA